MGREIIQEDIVIQPGSQINLNVTHDTLFDGKLTCLQNRDGYRFSIDSILLAHFAVPVEGDDILDLGAGCGIISLIMAYRWGNILKSITGIEIQDSLVDLARQNIAINKFNKVCRIINEDVKTLVRQIDRESFTRVICNPPFYKPGTGRTSRNRESLLARHQISATLEDFISAAAGAVKNSGSVYFIYPAEGLAELLVLTQKNKLEPKQIRLVYSYPHPDKSAKLVLVKCLKNGGAGVAIMPPLYVYKEKNGDYTSDVERYYR